jgi:hypothetical protein
MATFPRTYRDIDTIRLNNINILNDNNSVPCTGTVLTVSSGRAVMFPITYALDTIPGLSDLSGNLSSVSTVASRAFSTVVYLSSQLNGLSTTLAGISSYVLQQSTLLGGNIISTQTLSTYAVNLSTSVGQRFDAGGGGGGGAPSNWATYPATSNINMQGYSIQNTLATSFIDGTTISSFSNVQNGIGILVGGGNILTTSSFAIGSTNYIAASNSLAIGLNNSSIGAYSLVGGQGSLTSNTGTLAWGLSNSATSNYAVALGGAFNSTSSICSVSMGQYARSRIPNTLTVAGMASPVASILQPGSAQTSIFTMACTTAGTTSNTFKYFNSTNNTSNDFIQLGRQGIATSNFVGQQVRMDITGYQTSNANTANNGIWFGSYYYMVYADATTSLNLCVCDIAAGVVQRSGTGSSNLTLLPLQMGSLAGYASQPINFLNGTPSVIVRINMPAQSPSRNYSYRVVVSGTTASTSNTNWVARMDITEIMQA